MNIEHHIEFPKRSLDRGTLLAMITEEIPNFYNWDAQLSNDKISFKYDGKLRLIRMPTDFLKSGTIELTERTNTYLFICRTSFPGYYLLICLAVFIAGLAQKFVFSFPIPIAVIILLPLILYVGNWFYLKHTFKWSTSKVIRYIMDKHNGT